MAKQNVDIRDLLSANPLPDTLPGILLEELNLSKEFYNSNPERQFNRRTLYRNTFAFIEGILHYLKANTYSHYVRVVRPIVIFWEEHLEIEFPETGFCHLIDDDLLLLLLEKKFQIDESGKWRLKEDWLPTPSNIRFTFRVLSHIYGIGGLEQRFDGEGWQAFKRCVETRNRVTHPKALDDYEMRDAEMADLQTAIQWFLDHATELMKDMIGALEWDEPRALNLINSIPEEKRQEIVPKLMQILEMSDGDLHS